VVKKLLLLEHQHLLNMLFLLEVEEVAKAVPQVAAVVGQVGI
jgi:hypothetical protein